MVWLKLYCLLLWCSWKHRAWIDTGDINFSLIKILFLNIILLKSQPKQFAAIFQHIRHADYFNICLVLRANFWLRAFNYYWYSEPAKIIVISLQRRLCLIICYWKHMQANFDGNIFPFWHQFSAKFPQYACVLFALIVGACVNSWMNRSSNTKGINHRWRGWFNNEQTAIPPLK